MNTLINPENYESTYFENSDFPLGCYTMPSLTTFPHWHPHYEIIYVNQGTVDLYINGTLYVRKTKDIQIIPINSLHSIIPAPDSVYTALVIGEDLFQDLKNDFHFKFLFQELYSDNFLNGLTIYRTDPNHSLLATSIRTIISEFYSDNPMREVMIKLELCRFFTLLIRWIPENTVSRKIPPTQHTQNLKRAIEYLKTHYTEKVTISTMSHLMNLSEQHFSRLFKAYTGRTFNEYLIAFRLDRARNLILYSDLPITQIPELTGFCNPNYFSRMYKRFYGITPSATRKQL